MIFFGPLDVRIFDDVACLLEIDPDLHAAGRVFRGKSLLSALYPCRILPASCCFLKAVIFKDVLVCLSVLE